jgi:sterol desaturase/sphingolipid hydroxylase (fatty acid hydroxylase superfamily)
MTYRSFIGSTAGLVACLLVAALGAWLLWSHTGHILAAVPFLLLLACPLMHVMHRGHHHHRGFPPNTTDTSTTTKL